MSKFAVSQQSFGHALFLSLLALAGCSSSKGSGDQGSAGDDAGGSSGIHIGEGGTTQGGDGGATSNNAKCGNGIMELGEACDDRNVKKGDGCAADCKSVEENYICPEPGEDCVQVQICGDKKITGSESCDDGNHVKGDGCSSTCHLEPGSTCSFVGTLCQATACGDGIVAGQETCDDGQATPANGDGCSDTCQVESPTASERDGWVCPTPGQPCVRATCGNGTVEGSEQCDDGNNDTSDGCSPYCRKEPACPVEGGACSTACGDGILLPIDKEQGQECDDGNTVSGDGCNATCKVESGFYCTDE